MEPGDKLSLRQSIEKAIYGTSQRNDETNDSYLARHDVHFEELLTQKVTLEEIRAYILLRQSQLSSEDKKKIVIEHGGKLDYDNVCKSIRMLGSRFFGEFLQGKPGVTRNRTYDVNFVEDENTTIEESTGERAFAAQASSSTDEVDLDLDQEFVDALVAAEDADALQVSSFESELEEFFQETPELQQALVSYLEARNRLRDKQRNRGFWPTGNSKGKGGRKGFGKGKSKSRRDREQLLQRIARSTCRACGEKGHWRAECPNKGAKDRENPAGVAQVEDDQTSEVYEDVPEAASLAMWTEECAFFGIGLQGVQGQGVPVSSGLFRRHFRVAQANMEQFMRRLKQAAPAVNSPAPALKPEPVSDTTRDPKQVSPKRPPQSTARRTWTQMPRSPSERSWLSNSCSNTETIPQGSLALSMIEENKPITAILDTGASRCVLGSSFVARLLSQIPSADRQAVKEVPSSVRFRFGNNSTLTSQRKILLPLWAPNNRRIWLGVEVAPGKTPFLLSKRALKSLGGVIDTRDDTCKLDRLDQVFQLQTNAAGLYVLDIARMCSSSDKAENAMLAHPFVDPSRAQLQVPGDSDQVGLTVVKSASLNSKTNNYSEDRGKVNECKGPQVVQHILNPEHTNPVHKPVDQTARQPALCPVNTSLCSRDASGQYGDTTPGDSYSDSGVVNAPYQDPIPSHPRGRFRELSILGVGAQCRASAPTRHAANIDSQGRGSSASRALKSFSQSQGEGRKFQRPAGWSFTCGSRPDSANSSPPGCSLRRSDHSGSSGLGQGCDHMGNKTQECSVRRGVSPRPSVLSVDARSKLARGLQSTQFHSLLPSHA